MWRISRSASETPRQYGRQRELDDDKSSGHGVNEYLFGVPKKRSRSPSPVREVPTAEIIYRPSRRKQNPTVLRDHDEELPEPPSKEPEKKEESSDPDVNLYQTLKFQKIII